MTTFNEDFHAAEYLVSESNGTRSRDSGVLISGQDLVAGTVLGNIGKALSATSTANAGNTGTGAMGTVTVASAPSEIGAYALAYTDATHFTVTAPGGTTSTGVNGTPFSALGIGFTMTTGGSAMVAGEGFGIVVTDAMPNPTAVGTANAGNTGNSTMGTITTTGHAQVGSYKLVIIEPGTNAGIFTLEAPNGQLVGEGTVAVAFKGGGLSFTLADATDFVSGDGFTIIVAAGSGKYTQWNPAADDGSEVAVAILYAPVDATGGDTDCVITARDAEIAKAALTWPAGSTAAEQAYGLTQLARKGIIGR